LESKSNSNIQCVSIGLISNKSDLLVYQVTDQVSNNSFFRLIGGHIEFGESAVEALKREFKEEIDQEIININSLGVFENIFFYKGKEQHEFVSLFSCDFSNKEMYKKKEIIGYEGPSRTFNARWIDINQFKNNHKILYPDQILKYI